MAAKLPSCTLVNDPPRKSPTLVVVPVYNEMPHLVEVLQTIRLCWDGDILAIDDNSSDASLDVLTQLETVHVLHNRKNAGAGGVLLRGFRFAIERDYASVITMDADGQHSPFLIRNFIEAIEPHCRRTCRCRPKADFVWGSRYMRGHPHLSRAFQARQEVNKIITGRLNEITGYGLTDAFCGFRAYRVDALRRLDIDETGYGMFMEMTVRAWRAGIAIREIPVPLVYLDETRNFQALYKNTRHRLRYYQKVIDTALAATEKAGTR